ncbi:MAG: hypothetical protein RIF46_01450 [Cyclobacteriaceae bacterium]
MRRNHWKTLAAALFTIAFASCEKRGEPEELKITSAITSLTPYVNGQNQFEPDFEYGSLSASVQVTDLGGGIIEGGGIQLSNIRGATEADWNYRDVLRSIITTSSSTFQLDITGIGPRWNNYMGTYQEEYDSLAYFRAFVIVDGRLYFGEDVEVDIGD